MKRIVFFFSLAMGIAAVASAQPQPIQTIKDYGLKGPVKRVTELRTIFNEKNGESEYLCNTLEFDRLGRLSTNFDYAYDAKGRLIFSKGASGWTYYSYDINDRLLSEQTSNSVSKDEYVIYNYDKNGRLTTCECYTLDKKGNKTVDWVKSYKYDKQGRLLGAEAKTPDKKNPKVVFSYQVVYAADGTPKEYLFSHPAETVFDEYGEIIIDAGMVTDTLPYNEWSTYSVNHGMMDLGPAPDNRVYTKFDSHDNGIEWKDPDTTLGAAVFDEYGEMIEEGPDSIIFHYESRTIEYYDIYDLTVSLSEMNVVYSGIENPIQIVVNGVPDALVLDDIHWDGLILDKQPYDREKWPFSLEKDENGKFLLIPNVATGTIRVPVVILENGERKVVGYESFRVRRLPDPIIYIGKYPAGSVIPANELANMKGIRLGYPNDLFFHIQLPKSEKHSVTITKIPGAEDLRCNSNNWNPEILLYTSKVKPGSKVYVEAEIVLPNREKRLVTGSWMIGK